MTKDTRHARWTMHIWLSLPVVCCLQGSSEYNITVLLDQKDSERALRAVHSRFYLSDVPIGVGIVGPGLIGATLLEQLRDQVGVGSIQPVAACCLSGFVLLQATGVVRCF